jgi:hypothetical protein
LLLGIRAIFEAHDLIGPRENTWRNWRERVPMSVPFTKR